MSQDDPYQIGGSTFGKNDGTKTDKSVDADDENKAKAAAMNMGYIDGKHPDMRQNGDQINPQAL